MKNEKERNEIIDVGRSLLKTGLVARTWGNISAREDGNHYLITPSGLDYITMEPEDIVSVAMDSGEWDGSHRPSGERGVHKAAYEVFPEVNFVVHTHQIFATAMGLAGFDELDITADEEKRLGGIALAEYGLPSSEKLINAVKGAMEKGAHVVLMIHHGVLVCGKDRADAMERAELLEEICKRNYKGLLNPVELHDDIDGDALCEALSKENAGEIFRIVKTPELCALAMRLEDITSQLDDVSQMVGEKVVACDENDAPKMLSEYNAVLVKGIGAVVRADNEDDVEALTVLMDKMGKVKLHTEAYGLYPVIDTSDSISMHDNYINNYSKQKK